MIKEPILLSQDTFGKHSVRQYKFPFVMTSTDGVKSTKLYYRIIHSFDGTRLEVFEQENKKTSDAVFFAIKMTINNALQCEGK